MKVQGTGLFGTVAGQGAAHVARDEARRVAAVVYRNEQYPDDLFRQIIDVCRSTGIAMAGVQQHLAYPDVAARRCDVYLEDLSTGIRTALFENRGSEARGCRLDNAALAEVTASVERSLASKP